MAVNTTTVPDAVLRALPVAARATDAVKEYGRGDAMVRALNGVTVSFAKGQFSAIMGPSGSGKSTLLHCLAGLDRLTSGTVHIGDVELGSLGDRQLTLLRRVRVGFIFQSFNLVPTLSAYDNIVLPLTIAGRKPDAAALAEIVRITGTGSSTGRISFPAASSSALPRRGRWRASRRSSSPTSRPGTSTHARAPTCSTFSGTRFPSSGRRSSW
jgi:putative ABC transport system ATP-binding protein